MTDSPIRVLLVDDDEDDFVITRDLISQIGGRRYQLDWINNYPDALAAIHRREHDLCLLDYRLGQRTGLELLRESHIGTVPPPMILLTGQGDQAIDLEAMKAGAADYLVKGQLTADQLDRAIRYAIERKRAEERLRRERDLISRIMETSPVGIVVADRFGKITFANRSAEDVLGLTRNVVEQKEYSVLVWREADAEGSPLEGRLLPLKQLLDTSRPVHDVCHTVELAGSRRVLLSTNATPLFDAAGKIDGMVVTLEDITEQLALEAQLRQSQKMESVGQLAAGVAHDINNILTIIQGHTGLLQISTPPDSDAMKSLKQIAAASDRAASFIRRLLAFSRKSVVQTKILDVNAVLRNLESMLPRMLGEQIQLELHYQPELPPVAADAAMVEQIVMNLAVNARDAMQRGGRLFIGTASVEIPTALARQKPEARAGHFICMTVRDSGSGMERKVLQRLFEPFFTTKETGRGTGLGLATVYGIVKQHQGWIEVESEVGLGSTFRIYLPAASGQPDAPAAADSHKAETINGGRETILVVEDELQLLELTRSVLQRYQYRVFTATSGVEALRVWEEQRGQIDLLLTDMVMPGGMTGQDLAIELQRKKPGLKTIITSGYSDQLFGKDFNQGNTSILPKPYQSSAVARLIRNIFDAPGGQRSAGAAQTGAVWTARPSDLPPTCTSSVPVG